LSLHPFKENFLWKKILLHICFSSLILGAHQTTSVRSLWSSNIQRVNSPDLAMSLKGLEGGENPARRKVKSRFSRTRMWSELVKAQTFYICKTGNFVLVLQGLVPQDPHRTTALYYTIMFGARFSLASRCVRQYCWRINAKFLYFTKNPIFSLCVVQGERLMLVQFQWFLTFNRTSSQEKTETYDFLTTLWRVYYRCQESVGHLSPLHLRRFCTSWKFQDKHIFFYFGKKTLNG